MTKLIKLEKLNKEVKRRFVILTDMENEPDDSQTMVKLLMYSNEIDIEALIAVTSCWIPNEMYKESIENRILAYGLVRENLLKHYDGWPEADYLLKRTATGQCGFSMDAVGDNKSSQGSKLIESILLKDDERPIYFAINAGANTLAQAMWDMRKKYDKDKLDSYFSKIRILDDSGQDNAGAWINQEFPNVFYIRNHPQVFGLFGPDLNVGPQPWLPLNQYEWLEKNVRQRHGILGELYVQRFMKARKGPSSVVNTYFWFMDGGGTTGLMYVLNPGLSDPEQITWGGWGGRFNPNKCKIKAGQPHPSIDESLYEWNSMYACDSDTWFDEDENIEYRNNIFAPLWRFRKDMINDFQGRMDWCVKEYKNANHYPIACVNGDDGERCILRGFVKAGETIKLDASKSYDPDGDGLNFKWWIYNEAGTCKEVINITKNTNDIIELFIPNDVKPNDTIHVILEVIDDNEIVSMKSYRRIILEVVR